jgi:ketosteroid isomerase-like protein
VSQENVELVLSVQIAPDADVTKLFRDDALWAANLDTRATVIHPDFECIVRAGIGGDRRYTGTEGMRRMFMDWLAPWDSYRVEIEKAIDCGERVLVFVKAFGRLEGSDEEVGVRTCEVWTVRDGKIARWESFLDRSEALKAVGLEDQAERR